MARRRSTTTDAPGQDSFLDIVANLVGILIILVMVVGAQARQALEHVDTLPAEPESEAAEIDTEGPKAGVAGIESDVLAIKDKILREEMEIAYRRQERDRLNVLIVAAESSLAGRREGLDEQQRRQFDQQHQLLLAQQELQTLRQQQAALANQSRTVVIDHLPTPMAKTVFGRELHFRLSGGRLAFVPWDEFVALLKQDAPKRIEKLRSAPSFTETLGPLGDFQMRYVMKRSQRTLPTQVGTVMQELAELDYFEITPLSENLGEPVAQALQEGSEFLGRVRHEDPRTTTVTVWVYSDGFDQYRALKQALTKMGYLSAARPLPDGQPMGGSPQGRRSAAQ